MAGELLELITSQDPHLRVKLTMRIQQTIADSFRHDKARMTADETRRRFKIIEVLLRELRADHGWAWTRIMDVMPHALRCKLDGMPWDPTEHRALWLPQ